MNTHPQSTEQDIENLKTLDLPNRSEAVRENAVLAHKAVNVAFYRHDPERPVSPYRSEDTEIVEALLLEGIDIAAYMSELGQYPQPRSVYTIMTDHDARQGINAQEQLKSINDVLSDTEFKLSIWNQRSTTVERVKRNVDIALRKIDESYASSSDFKDRVVAQMRAMRIVVQSVLSASTHHEKNARVRGLDEIISNGIEDLESLDLKFDSWSEWPNSVFGSDYSRARLQRQVWELEKELKDLKSGKRVETPDDDKQDGGLPF